MRSFKLEGIIIKRRNYNDADRLLTVFTKEQGKITIKAPGVRKITSRRSSHIELLNHSLLNLHKGSGMPILTEAQTIDSFSIIKSDLAKVGDAYHLCELIDGLCPENQENNRVFFLLRNILTKLSQEFIFQTNDYSGLYSLNEYSDHISSYALGLHDEMQFNPLLQSENFSLVMHEFEINLLTTLGYWNKSDRLSTGLDTHTFIENILERKLKSKKIFSKMQ
jgi:hypothetical protein